MKKQNNDLIRSIKAMDECKRTKRPFYYWVDEFTKMLDWQMLKRKIRLTEVFRSSQGVKLKAELI